MWVYGLLGCSHRRLSFPLTPRRKVGLNGGQVGTYVVCLTCGTEFEYNWQEMRIQKPIKLLVPTRSVEEASLRT